MDFVRLRRVEKNLFPRHGKSKHKIVSMICKLFGHRWAYKNYEMTWKDFGNPYDYKYSRRCQRCNIREVLRSEEKGWEPSTDSPEATF